MPWALTSRWRPSHTSPLWVGRRRHAARVAGCHRSADGPRPCRAAGGPGINVTKGPGLAAAGTRRSILAAADADALPSFPETCFWRGGSAVHGDVILVTQNAQRTDKIGEVRRRQRWRQGGGGGAAGPRAPEAAARGVADGWAGGRASRFGHGMGSKGVWQARAPVAGLGSQTLLSARGVRQHKLPSARPGCSGGWRPVEASQAPHVRVLIKHHPHARPHPARSPIFRGAPPSAAPPSPRQAGGGVPPAPHAMAPAPALPGACSPRPPSPPCPNHSTRSPILAPPRARPSSPRPSWSTATSASRRVT
jgi:hypothetical protein